MCRENKICIPEVRKRTISTKIDSSENQYFSDTICEEMRINVYYPMLDDLIGEIDNRFFSRTLEIINAVVGNLMNLVPIENYYVVLEAIFQINSVKLLSEVTYY